MKILVINAGSSSLKYQLIDMDTNDLLAKGICEQISYDNCTFTHKVPSDESKNIIKKPQLMADHMAAINIVLDTLTSAEHGVIKSMDEIGAVGHRVLHGGEKFKGSVLFDEKVEEAIKECFPLGPLHNPANLTGIKACEAIMKGVPQVAVFDTGFHSTMPDYAYMYALPYEYYEKYGIRRYGFHGTSHRFVSKRCIELLGSPEHSKIVTCHLGNGSSISAVVDGKCFDTTMGVTPLEGIIMGTRCGSIDPAIVPIIMKNENLTPDEIDTVMNKKSGMLGLTGTSDNRTIEQRAKQGDKRAKLVESMLCHQLTKYIGGFAAAMGGLDAVVFTGGIGENNPQYRTRVAEKLEFLGTAINEETNKLRGEEVEISVPGSKVKLFVIPTNEELMIAQDTKEIVEAL
ncbi:MAG: acetate kinase [Oscillospiraceae bacterium]|nr:acetate kinase [Oscillospiraceae bacterium]MDY3937046.1 acetate kinase [Oscillospiraceae bacterium]